MQTSRTYGKAPYKIVFLHGGPGIPGYLKPLCEQASGKAGVLEVLNCGDSVNDQVFEVYEEMLRHCDLPVALVGHSWGAWLGWIFASKYPELVKKLILIGSGPFEQRHAGEIMRTRMKRLEEADQQTLKQLSAAMENAAPEQASDLFRKMGRTISKADHFDPVEHEDEILDYQYHVYKMVWPEAEKLRISGALLKMAGSISCPVVAFHGNYDPHPFQGVYIPLKKNLKDFRMHIIDKCGHYPWLEKQSAGDFLTKLLAELQH